ncbi:hypothetical protein AB0D42_25465 [Streptomyces sp. NPDC048304]
MTAAIGDAFASGVHAGVAVIAAVFLCAALASAFLYTTDRTTPPLRRTDA